MSYEEKTELNSDFLLFCFVFCFVFVGLGGPGGGFGAPGGGFRTDGSSGKASFLIPPLPSHPKGREGACPLPL